MEIIFSDDEIQEFNRYARGTIEEYYPLLKRAVTPRAATKMKKSLTQRMEDGLDGRMSLEDNKVLFHAIIKSCCAASIAAQVHFSNKAFRAKLSKEALLEKCRRDAGNEWDEDEIYFVYDELKPFFPEMRFEPMSYCAGLLSLTAVFTHTS